MAFELPDLPYAYDALEPHIDAETMRIHHDLHHKAYVDNANNALAGTEWADRPVESVLTNIEIMPEDKQAPVRNNAGGHANHSLFWQIMGPDGGGAPSGDLGCVSFFFRSPRAAGNHHWTHAPPGRARNPHAPLAHVPSSRRVLRSSQARDASVRGIADPSLDDTVNGILKFMYRKGIISVAPREVSATSSSVEPVAACTDD